MRRQRLSHRLPNSRRAQGCLVWSSSRTAFGQFAVDDDRWNRTNAERLGTGGHRRVVHVEHRDLARRARDAVDQVDGFLTRRAAGAEHFYFSQSCHFVLLDLLG